MTDMQLWINLQFNRTIGEEMPSKALLLFYFFSLTRICGYGIFKVHFLRSDMTGLKQIEPIQIEPFFGKVSFPKSRNEN